MPTIHLNMMKLEGDRKRCFYPIATIFSPHNHRITKLIGVLVDNTIKFRLYHCRCTYDHTILNERTLALSSHLRCQLVIVFSKLLNIIGVCNITRINSPFAIVHNNIDGNAVIFEKFVFSGQKIELVHVTCSLPYTPTQQSIEFSTRFSAHFQHFAHIKRLSQCHHRHRRRHPKLKRLTP